MKTDLDTIAAMLDPLLSTLECRREAAAREGFHEDPQTRSIPGSDRPHGGEVARDVLEVPHAMRGGWLRVAGR